MVLNQIETGLVAVYLGCNKPSSPPFQNQSDFDRIVTGSCIQPPQYRRVKSSPELQDGIR